MSKRDIPRAAKRAGLTVVSAHYSWTATPGEMMPQWEVEFGPELDGEIEYFGNTQEVIDYIQEHIKQAGEVQL